MSRRRAVNLRWVVSAAACAVLASCTSLLAPEVPAPPEGAPPGFQDCAPPYVFEGDSTMAALGIADGRVGHEATLRGHIRITQDTITHEEFAPPGAPGGIAEGQVLCVTWPDGSGMAMMLAEPWRPPGLLNAAAGPNGSPLLLLAVAVGVLVAVSISWVAFRRGPRTQADA